MSNEKIHAHAKKYSKTYAHKNGRWILDFDGMAKKTVLKLLLSKYAPLSVETIHSAAMFDQATIKNFETKEIEYSDALEVEITTEEVIEAKVDQVEAAKKEVKEAKKNGEPIKLL